MSLLNFINARNDTKYKNSLRSNHLSTHCKNQAGKRGGDQIFDMQEICRSLWRENCGGISGEVAGGNFPVDADQSFWLALTHIKYSVSLTKIGECDKDSIFCSFR